jgi:hypothetical protein
MNKSLVFQSGDRAFEPWKYSVATLSQRHLPFGKRAQEMGVTHLMPRNAIALQR